MHGSFPSPGNPKSSSQGYSVPLLVELRALVLLCQSKWPILLHPFRPRARVHYVRRFFICRDKRHC